ncbi:MAG: DNA replication protein DnaD, partial [Oscillospiraceae bacterium]|nr:DNA replication protein DnaD [Oscillospiraceae bacterium]
MSALLLPNEILSMSAQAARLLVESGDGDGALLYLALLECGGDAGRAAARLRWQDARLRPAWERLAALGLAQTPSNTP